MLRKLASRSPREIAFRLRQEAANLLLMLAPPSPDASAAAPLAGLPDPARVLEALRGTAHESALTGLARRLLRHEFPLLGMEVHTGARIDWRRDYASGRSSAPVYFRRIPYLDYERTGDHKTIWELNRHQHLVALAQAFRFTGERAFLEEIIAEIRSWLQQNPYQRGINWASALEVGFRTLSWIWVFHLAGQDFDPAFRVEFLEALYRHGRHLETNLSFYFSPNTHLIGEAVALHALGTLFPGFPGAKRWRERGGRVVQEQLEKQVLPDGAHFELSSYYHVYALDFFLLHYVLAGRPSALRPAIERMAAWLHALVGISRSLPLIGDDDGGRVFHSYGDRSGFACATLATCAALFARPDWLRDRDDLFEQAAWWVGAEALDIEPASREDSSISIRFPESGIVVMNAGRVQAIVDVGSFAPGSAGHSHSDALSLTVRDIVVDAGTFTYVSDPLMRNWFRGSAAHNTIRIDGRDQAAAAGPFRWSGRPAVEVMEWQSGPARDYLDARCEYSGFLHRRRVLFVKPDLLLVLDEISGPDGEHEIEQFWHPGRPACAVSPNCFAIGGGATLAVAGGESVDLLETGEHAWRSLAFGSREPWPVIRVVRRGPLPVCLAGAIFLTTDSAAR